MRGITVVLVLAFAMTAANVAAVEPYLLDLSGNNFSTDEPAAIGEQLKVAAELSVVQSNPPFALPGILDWSTEYTAYIHGLTLASNPSEFMRNFTGGILEIWSDSSVNAPWTPTTPVSNIPARESGTVPSTFTDGVMILRGTFSSFTILDFTIFGSDTGTITNTNIDFTAGAALQDLVSQGIQNDWSWNGWYDVVAPVPSGYFLLYGGKLEREAPTAVEPATWGAIKRALD